MSAFPVARPAERQALPKRLCANFSLCRYVRDDEAMILRRTLSHDAASPSGDRDSQA